MFNYALENGDGYTIGKGIGSISDYGDSKLPPHFGMSNISSLVYQGGVIYLILIITVFYTIYYRMSKNKNFKYGILIYIFLIFLSYYTQPFTESYLTFFVGLICMCLGEVHMLISNKEVIEKEKINEK